MKIAACLFLVLISVRALAQQEAYESPAGTKFLLYTPPGYNSSSSTFPLLLSLHSRGEVGDDLTELTSNNPEQMPSRLIYLSKWPQDLPFIVLTPQLRPEEGDPDPEWGPQWPAEYIDEVVRYVTANFRVDTKRIYVTGMSKGGIGTWTYAAAYPEKVAAIIPMSGRSDLSKACAVKGIPTWVFHGDGDRLVVPQYSIDMVNAIKACQLSGIYTPRLNILHARDHNGWNEIYNGSSGYKVYEWLLMFRKGDTSNKKPYVNAGRDLRIALRDDPLHIIGDFFDWDGSITNVTWKQTAGTPLTLNDTGSEFLQIRNMQPGLYEFELTVTDDKGAVNSDRVSVEITDHSALPAITQLVLINGKTDTDIGNLSEGQIIDRTALNLTEMNIRAVATDGTASVKFTVNSDQNTRTRNPTPYLIKNQTTSPEWVVRDGVYLICATAYPKSYAGGDPGVSQCYKVTITDGEISESCSGTGKIEREVWNNITGSSVSSIPLSSQPSATSELTFFESPVNVADNYGARIRGYICAPVTGNYTFWISSDDRSELWLSTGKNPADKRMIASVTGWTRSREWTKYASQQSAAITLQGGQRYYIEALHKEASGGDNLAVGWQLPDGKQERPIPGARLIPFGTVENSRPAVSITSPEDGEIFSAPASVNIAATASDSDGSIIKVEFYNGTTKLGEDGTTPYAFAWNNVSEGNYTVTAKAIDNNGASNTSSVDIVVVNSQACAGTGTIEREVWNNITGTSVSSIPLNSQPSSTSKLTIFESPVNVADNYGARIRGYICAPVTGNYTFWISSDDRSELWLSTSENLADKRMIASVTGWTRSREWTKYAGQRSAAITLQSGQRYYIEALHKEASGGDNLAVGWQLTNGGLERPIPGNRLSPYISQTGTTSFSAVSTTTSQADNLAASDSEFGAIDIQIFPNPAQSGVSSLTISGLKGLQKDVETRVEIMRMTGEVIFSEKIFCELNCNDYLMTVNEVLTPGIYLVNVVTESKRFSKKLLIR